MQLKSYVQGRWQARSTKRLPAGRDDGRSHCRGSRAKVSTSRARSTTRAASADRAAPPDISRARRAAQGAREVPDAIARKSSTRLSYATGATAAIPGSTSTAASARFSCTRARARASCRTAMSTSTATSKAFRRRGTFVGQHICVPLEGAAVHINAFNFPVWGMLEKLAPTLLAGMPAIVKPATPTAYLTELVVRRIVESGILPEGALQLDLRQRRRSVRSSRLPGRRLVHRLGAARRRAAQHPAIIAQLRALHRGDRIRSTPRARTGRGAGHAGVRPLREGSRARDDGEGGAEVHRDPQGDRAGSACATRRSRRSRRARRRSSSAIRGSKACAWARSRALGAAARGARRSIARAAARCRVAARRSRTTWSWRAPIARRAPSCRRCCCSADEPCEARAIHASRLSGRCAP